MTGTMPPRRQPCNPTFYLALMDVTRFTDLLFSILFDGRLPVTFRRYTGLVDSPRAAAMGRRC